MAEIRRNVLTGEWVIIAPERAKRPTNLGEAVAKPSIPLQSATCPFCPGNEPQATDERYRFEADDKQWLIRSVVNKFSVLGPAPADAEPVIVDHHAGEFRHEVPGVGLHEVLVEHRRHDLTPALYSRDHLEQLLLAYAQRFTVFSENPLVKHVIVFKNHGEEAGASQQHPHSQIVGLPIIPGQVNERIERARAYHRETGDCLACHMIGEEIRQQARIIDENEAFVAFIPFAALSPYHVWIFPKRHAACFSETLTAGTRELAEVLHRVLGRVYSGLGNPAYNLVIRSLSPSERESPSFHWYISVVPRVGKLAGFELGTGMFVNPSTPEMSAAALRRAPMPC